MSSDPNISWRQASPIVHRKRMNLALSACAPLVRIVNLITIIADSERRADGRVDISGSFPTVRRSYH